MPWSQCGRKPQRMATFQLHSCTVLTSPQYLPRNGYATIPQFIQGTHDAFGMSTDLSTVLAVFGAIADGNLLGWSIGGAQHTGISGSHGNYETDGSVVHGDMNQYGSTNKFIMAQFQRLYAMQPHAATANYNLEVLRAFRATRFADSIAMNPYYFYGIFPGLTVSMAAHAFIYRLMANKSAEYPEGILTRETLKSFMAVSGPDSNLVHTPGHERIPSPFYRRNDADLYSLFGLNADTQYFGKTVPQLTEFGCNQGRVNSFSTYSIAELTGGAYADGAAVLKNPLCFAGATLQATAGSLLGINGAALDLLNTALSPIVGDCPAITHPNFSQLQQCPGFALYGGPTGYVAPGAIQEK